MAFKVARIAISAATYSIDKPYDYLIPDSLADTALPGTRVLAPFGIGNKKSEGVILSLIPDSKQKNLKYIDSLLDETPLLSDENIRLALWMSDRFFCTVFDALKSMLPAGIWRGGKTGYPADKTVSSAVLSVDGCEAIKLSEKRQSNAPKQAAVIRLLAETGSMPLSDIYYITEATSAVVKALEKQGILEIIRHELLRRPEIRKTVEPKPIALNDEQKKAFDCILPLLKKADPKAALLYGVTGSGKTHVYIKLIEEAIKLGKASIVLVPEIALTPQVVGIFASYFGEAVAVLHSSLGIGERYDEWKRIRSGTVRVVVGTRSAVFAPLNNIGLIVIDEEQEHTYKSENSPRYHARDVAKFRVARAGGLLLLSSATPSVESMYSARTGKYDLFTIENRFNERDMPAVILADMKKELKNGNGGSVSSVLRRELEINQQNDEQSILFINRRGTNPIVTCVECGFIFQCRSCSVSMTYHSVNRRLMCHYCGYSVQIPDKCPGCAGKLKFAGAGTQKVESELLELFPDINIIRMDADTVSRKNSHDKLLSDFREKKAHILLGTQMVTKGLDFENVTLVGVISADSLLYMGDFRAFERTFSLITQVVGRSGRGEKTGRAVIQTFTPGHDVITLASKQDYNSFYEREILLRQSLGSPPVNALLSLTAVGAEETAVQEACLKLRAALDNYFRGHKDIKLLGPTPAAVSKIKNKYRYRLLVSCENTKMVRDTIAHTIREFSRDKLSRAVTVYADADTYDF